MKLYLAQVTSTLDFTRTGVVEVSCPDEPRITEAVYTSPFFSPRKDGGIFAPPELHSSIIIAFNLRTKKAYYISTVVDEEGQFFDEKISSESGTLKETPIVSNPMKLYNDTIPASMTFKNNENNGLHIRNVNSTLALVNETSLTNNAKKLSLHSSPEVDCVELDNGHGDFIKINGMPESAMGLPVQNSRSVKIKSEMGQEYATKRGGIDIRVSDGKDITIENGSTGWWAAAGFLKSGLGKSGNVNIFSKYRTIRLAAKGVLPTPANGGSVIIETATSEILVTNNAITITTDAGGQIVVDTAGRITLNSISNVSVEAPNISLDATVSVDINAPIINIGGQDTNNINLFSTNTVSVDGPVALNLNTNTARPATPIPITPSPNEAERTYLKTEYPLGTKYI